MPTLLEGSLIFGSGAGAGGSYPSAPVFMPDLWTDLPDDFCESGSLQLLQGANGDTVQVECLLGTRQSPLISTDVEC